MGPALTVSGFKAHVPGSRKLLRRTPLTFDGNRNDDNKHWLFPEGDFESLWEENVEALMQVTQDGNIRWVTFPPEGFRL